MKSICAPRVLTDAEVAEIRDAVRSYAALPDSEKMNLHVMTREWLEKIRDLFDQSR